jgi:hypothetical protein
MDKSFVSPFLFDIKRSEVNGPILQFQSTIFHKDDIKKLVNTLNKACGETSITDARLEKAFEVWYPTLETELNKLKGVVDETDEKKEKEEIASMSSEILEEILDLSRNNQKLLRNPDPKLYENLDDLRKIMQEQFVRMEKNSDLDSLRISRKFNPIFLDEIMHISTRNGKNPYGFLIALSFFKTDFPWIYDSGKELIDIIKTRATKETKMEAVRDFKEMMEFTLQNPMIREFYGNRKDYIIYMKEIPYILMRYVEEMVMNSK